MELSHPPYKKAAYDDHVGAPGLDRLGKKDGSKVSKSPPIGNPW